VWFIEPFQRFLIADQAPISTCETVQNSSGCVKTEWLKIRPTAQLHKVRTGIGSDRVVSERLDYAGHYKKPALLEKRNYGAFSPRSLSAAALVLCRLLVWSMISVCRINQIRMGRWPTVCTQC